MTGIDAKIAGTIKDLRRARENRRPALTILGEPGHDRRIGLEHDEMILGHTPDADIRITSAGAVPRHAALKVRAHDCILVDYDSPAGVLLNGIKVHSAVLRDGDVIQTGGDVFVFHED